VKKKILGAMKSNAVNLFSTGFAKSFKKIRKLNLNVNGLFTKNYKIVNSPFFVLSSRSFSTNSNNYIRLLHTRNDSTHLNLYFVTGFVDGEGSYGIYLYKNLKYRSGYQVSLVFQISLGENDKVLLEKIKNFFSVGEIVKDGDKAVKYRVRSIKELEVIIAHFNSYPLLTQKRLDFIL
jgi:hypothetical protein